MLVTESMMREEGGLLAAPHGQGKKVMTIQADQGDYVKIITDTPFTERNRPGKQVSEVGPRGSRPMHRTTLTMASQPYTDYHTTSHVMLQGGRALGPSEVAHPYPSQHTSQLHLQHPGALNDWRTNYKYDFIKNQTQHPWKLHMPSIKNGLSMQEGTNVKQAMKLEQRPTYWSQYKRTHDMLGTLRGPGVSREPAVRRQVHVLTGADLGAGWSEQNRRVSGNRVLYNIFDRKSQNYLSLN